ncbi:3-phosphoinositide-dependent protein kinase 1 [Neocloeon triangulifer]|uniref:3-phosphoinositide-dependent protein kinase 1 n=1 Tax=Neocloeon triangulifer TaxID=2078957 RepID=UPI00286EF5FF|nr:3-phosphoinositide-dependent protein kinase 1 [Neocloeon triangulifer]
MKKLFDGVKSDINSGREEPPSSGFHQMAKPAASMPVSVPANPREESLASSSGASVNSNITFSAPSSVSSSTSPQPANKRSAKDFIFGKVIGEGSFSTVYLAKDIHTHKELAIKVCEKRHVIREKKVEYIKREKEVLNILSMNVKPTGPFFVKLFCTFQDADRLYFALTYAKNGELLPYITRVGCFDIDCTRFYSAEILQALEHMHSLGIIHRDLKPENILLNENMHVLITDFGSAKILNQAHPSEDAENEERAIRRRNSFVGTAQYVSPELLTDKKASPASDLWALGCIIYQMVAGITPFHAGSEYMIFQKILKLDYFYPDGFCASAKDLVEKLLVLDGLKRLGAADETGYPSIKLHPFYQDIDFDSLYCQTPPVISPYLPGTSSHEELRSNSQICCGIPDNIEPGLDDRQLTRLLGLNLRESTPLSSVPESPAPVQEKSRSKISSFFHLSDEELKQKLEAQKASSKWNCFVEGNLILKQGLIDKRKGLFARRRMLLLTMGPHLYYVNPTNMVLKGEIPWSSSLRVEARNFKIFLVHTPNRIYYLEDPEGYALEWCRAIEEVRKLTYGPDS